MLRLRECSRCKVNKEIQYFYSNKARYDGVSNYCKSCSSTTNKIWYSKSIDDRQCVRCRMQYRGYKHSRYCSKCKATRIKKDISGYKTCKICNIKFPYRESLLVRSYGNIKHKYAKYCSKACSNMATIDRNKKWIRSKEVIEQLRILTGNRFRGIKLSKERREKASKRLSGSNSHFWKGGVCKENKRIRSSFDLKSWREEVFKRDNYTCQHCKKKGVELNAHHIKKFILYPRLRTDVDNGITLCVQCHRKTDNYGTRNAQVDIIKSME